MNSQVSVDAAGIYTCTVSVTFSNSYVSIQNPSNIGSTTLYIASKRELMMP